MNYTNLSNRLRLPGDQVSVDPAATTILSLESGKNGTCLRVRKAATATRRKIAAFKLSVAAVALAAASFAHQASAQTVVIQPLTEADSKDTKIYNSVPTSNFASNLNVTSQDTGAHFLSLVQFNLGTVPAGQISNATLTLYSTGLGASGAAAVGGTVTVQAITSAWSETAADVTANAPLATYNAFFGATPTVTLGNVVTSQNVTAAGFINFNITSLVQQWQTGALANNGVIFYLSTAGGDVGFADVDSSTVVGSAPSLSVTVVPEPSTTVALAAGGLGLLLLGRHLRQRSVVS